MLGRTFVFIDFVREEKTAEGAESAEGTGNVKQRRERSDACGVRYVRRERQLPCESDGDHEHSSCQAKVNGGASGKDFAVAGTG